MSILAASFFVSHGNRLRSSQSVLLICMPLWLAYNLVSRSVIDTDSSLVLLALGWTAAVSWKSLAIAKTCRKNRRVAGALFVKSRNKNKFNSFPVEWLLVLVILIWFGACDGLQILTPMDNMEYWKNLALDQSLCATAIPLANPILGISSSSSCNWYYWASQIIMNIGGYSLSYPKASLLVGLSVCAAVLTIGELVEVVSESKLAAICSQLLFITTFGWYGFSYIQGNGLNGMIIAIACTSASLAIAMERFSERLRQSQYSIKKCFLDICLLAIMWLTLKMSVSAHTNMISIYVTLGLSLLLTLMLANLPRRAVILGALIASLLATCVVWGFRTYAGLELYPTLIDDPRHWQALIDTRHYGYYSFFSSRFYYYLPPWKSGPYDEVPLALVCQLLLGIMCFAQTGKYNVASTLRLQVETFFSVLPFVTLSVCLLPPLSDALIRNFPGDPNCYYRWLWGSLPWINIPVLASFLRLNAANSLNKFFAVTVIALYGIVSLFPISINNRVNFFRARTVHLFERNNAYKLKELDRELLPVLQALCANTDVPAGASFAGNLLTDSYVGHYLAGRTCLQSLIGDHRQFWPAEQLKMGEAISRHLNINDSYVLIRRKQFSRFSSPTAATAAHWHPELDFTARNTPIYKLTDQDIVKHGFKKWRETRHFILYRRA